MIRKRVLIPFLILLIGLSSRGQEFFKVYFDLDKDSLLPSEQIRLDSLLSEVKAIEVLKLEGYCDYRGSSAYNKDLADRRIHTVWFYLLSKGVQLSGDEEQLAIGKDFDQHPVRSKNRNVTLYYNIPVEKDEELDFSALQKGDIFTLPSLHFYNYSDEPLPGSIPVLEKLYQKLEENPAVVVEIQGHICCMPNDIDQISMLRARRVHNYLINKGILPSRLTYKGYGSSRARYPLPEKSEAEKRANRRVDILVLETQ